MILNTAFRRKVNLNLDPWLAWTLTLLASVSRQLNIERHHQRQVVTTVVYSDKGLSKQITDLVESCRRKKCIPTSCPTNCSRAFRPPSERRVYSGVRSFTLCNNQLLMHLPLNKSLNFAKSCPCEKKSLA